MLVIIFEAGRRSAAGKEEEASVEGSRLGVHGGVQLKEKAKRPSADGAGQLRWPRNGSEGEKGRSAAHLAGHVLALGSPAVGERLGEAEVQLWWWWWR